MSRLTDSEIAYYYLGKNTVECRVSDNLISIRDSYLIVDDAEKEDVLVDLLNKCPWFKESRTVEDMFNEWKVHNIFYQRGWAIERTKHTDLELNQSWIVKLGYKICSKLFKEKR